MPRLPYIAMHNHPANDSAAEFLATHENGLIIVVVPKDGDISTMFIADKHFNHDADEKAALERTLLEVADTSLEQLCSDMRQTTIVVLRLFRILTQSQDEPMVHTTTAAMISYLFQYALANSDLFDISSGLIEFVDEGDGWFVGDYGRPASLTPTRH